MKIKSITGSIHDTGFGGYPYKVTVMVELPMTDFKKLCPKNDLGHLVLDVNNTVYAINNNIPAYNPSIDSQGSRRAKNGVKTLEFVYFLKDHQKAIKLGFKTKLLKNGEYLSAFSDYVNLMSIVSI